MDWSTANTWASNLETGSGVNMVDDWRLPIMTVADPDSNLSHNGSTDRGSNVLGSSSEMASLFFDTLGNKSVFSTSGTPQPPGVGGLKNAGSFENMQSAGYWLGTVYAPNPSSAWIFVNDSGLQLYTGKSDLYSAMAVRSGDVLASAVPESETYAMMLAGLAMVGALSRRRSRAAKPVAL
ncbi:MAG: PEP-CTERM sorting domain-containing protein [Comamonadaceae bacterium]|nr:PEP-CTERM sorting domain-containing protein [Comamonadaceae bacterium]